ncbi:MAG: FxsA family protein [Campylobacterota bacterium]
MPLFLLYLFIETLVSVAIASSIGGLLTFVEIIFSAVVGIFIISSFQYSLRENLQAVSAAQMSMQEFQRMNFASIVGAILLIVPGFFTDIVGLLLQFEKFANFFARKILHLKTKNSPDTTQEFDPFTKKGEDDEIIDVEVLDRHSTDKR